MLFSTTHFIFTLTVLLSLLGQSVKAQLGPSVISPEQNATVPAGGKIDIVYRYLNVGTGNYSVDIQLWQDAAITIPISDIVMDHKVKPGNSSGVKLNFYLNDTYTWKVPRGLNSTFWLTVTERAQTAIVKNGDGLRSRPVMLHTSAASLMSSPASYIALLALSFITLQMFSL
jgi:hypothetical protein